MEAITRKEKIISGENLEPRTREEWFLKEYGGGGGGGTTVVANPSGSATADLNKLQVGSSIYGIPSGTDVVANPSGTATADLTKLQVGSNIYGIPSGGLPYTDVTGTLTAGSTSITLSDASITTTSTLDLYTDAFGVNPTNVVVSNGSVTLTFEAQQTNIGVKVRVS